MTRFIFITGGVVSSLGKGLSSAALGALLQARGFGASDPIADNSTEAGRAANERVALAVVGGS